MEDDDLASNRELQEKAEEVYALVNEVWEYTIHNAQQVLRRLQGLYIGIHETIVEMK